MDSGDKEKLARVDDERQRRRTDRAAEALRRIEQVGKATLEAAAKGDAPGERPGRLSRVLFEAATGEKPRRGPRSRGAQDHAVQVVQRAMDAARNAILSGGDRGLEDAARQLSSLPGAPARAPLADLVQQEARDEHAHVQRTWSAALDSLETLAPAPDDVERDRRSPRSIGDWDPALSDIEQRATDSDPSSIDAASLARQARAKVLEARRLLRQVEAREGQYRSLSDRQAAHLRQLVSSRVDGMARRAIDGEEAVVPRQRESQLPHQTQMERAFGMDFSDVRVKLGASHEMGELGANAVTHGDQIIFATRDPDPALVAHELTHVVQHRRSGSAPAAPAPIEQGARDSLEAEAQSVGARVAAGARIGPIVGVAHGAALREDDPNAKDVFPPDTMLQVVGDRFKLSYKRGEDPSYFVVAVHYEGDLQTDGPFIKNNTQELKALLSDKKKKLNAKVTKVETNKVTVDAYGDGTSIVTFEDTAGPDTNARKHAFSWKVSGQQWGAMSTMWIKLPAAAPAADPQKPADAKKPAGTVPDPAKVGTVTFTAVDAFQLSATRFGDSKSVSVALSGGAGVINPAAQSFLVPIEGSLDKIAPKIIKNDGRDIEIDLNGDNTVDLKFVHTVRSMSKSPDQKSEIRDHHFRRFDKDGVMIGTYKGGMLYAFSGPVKAIPKEQSEDTNKPDVNVEAPVTRPPVQGDEIGELPDAVNAPGDVIEMRIDGDGDRTKELVLRFKALPAQDQADKKGQIRIDIIQVSSSHYRTHTFDTTADAAKNMKPWMVEVADGKNPTKIQVMSSVNSAYGQTLDMKLSPPTIDETSKQRTYTMEFAGRSITYSFPEETSPANPLVKKSEALANTGNVARFEVVLGEFGDKFWVMHEAQPGGGEVFSVAAVGPNGPVAARGVALLGGSAAITSFAQVNAGPVAFGIDTNKDGKADILLHDALSAPVFSGKHKPSLVDERDHRISVSGPAVSAEQKWNFWVRGGVMQQAMFDGDGDKQAAAAASSAKTLGDQQADSQTKDENGKVTKEGDVNAMLSRIAGALLANRQKAQKAGLISEKLFKAWHELSQQLIMLGPQIGANKVDPKVQEAAAKNADIFYAEFAAATVNETDTQVRAGHGYSSSTTTNKYTGTSSRTASYQGTTIDGPGLRLPGEIRSGKWPQVTTDFDALVRGLDRWIGAKQKPGSEAEQQQKYLVGMQDSMKEIKDKPGMMRVMASFQPDASYNTNTKKWAEIPLMLFAWKEDGKWWLKDITNPARKAFLDRVPAKDGEVHPPFEIFQALDYARHFPKGVIHYQIPGGAGGQIKTTERKEWYEFLQWVGLGLAVIGISLATMGTGTVAATAAAVAFAASGVAGAVYAIGDLEARARHGDLTPTAVVMNIAQIVAGIFSAGAVISGRIVAAAAQADIAAAKGIAGASAWTGAAARIASVAQKAYIPALATATAADAVNLLALGAETIDQIAQIRAAGGSEADQKAAIAALIAQGLVMGGITILSIKGDMPQIFSGKPTIVIDIVHGIPIARANHLEIAGTKMSPKGGADAQATARWQSHGIEEAAKEGNKEAQALLKDAEFMGAYRKWMEQAEPKVIFVDGKPKANFAKGAEPSPELQKRLQEFVDTKGVGISLYEKAWANAAEFRKVEDAIAKQGGKVDGDPGTPGWKDNRAAVVKALGGDEAAEALVSRYEKFRAGAKGADPHAHLAERAHLKTLLPDSEVDAIRNVFPEFEVYVTGGATQTGKKISKDIPDVDIIVVVPKDTPPELMAAIESRARGVTVRPDPAFLQANGLDPNKTLALDVKVMTQDQFFGFTTAATGQGKKGSSPLNFTRIDATPAEHAAAVTKAGAGNDWIAHLKSQLPPDAQVRLDAELKTKSPQQVMDSFKGDIDAAVKSLAPGAPKKPPDPDTVEMFGKPGIPASGPARWKALEDPNNWQPARAALHDKLIAKAKAQAQQFADKVQKGEPTLFAMRGNTAAGKTRAVSGNVPELAGPMAATKDLPHRSVNPDNFKADLIAETPGGMTSTQVHSESSMLASRLEKELLGMKTTDGKELASILIDKRLATVGDVQGYAKMAKDSGRKFVLFDVDAPLEVSLGGVLERVPGNADPLPPFEVVASGFDAVRSNRKPVVDLFRADPSFGTYTLYGTTPKGDRVEIAVIGGGKDVIKDPDLFAKAIAPPGSASATLSTTRITDEGIKAATANLPADRAAKVADVLRPYEGWTWKAALDAHSVKKPPPKTGGAP